MDERHYYIWMGDPQLKLKGYLCILFVCKIAIDGIFPLSSICDENSPVRQLRCQVNSDFWVGIDRNKNGNYYNSIYSYSCSFECIGFS